MKKKAGADRPKAAGGKAYHLHTKPGDLAPRCLLVGAPERAALIADTVFDRRSAKCVGEHRGLMSFTGTYEGVPMSVVTTGMGSASTGIVLPEAVDSGAKAFIRVGTCGAIQPEAMIGDVMICTGAVRLDGASDNWALPGYPAVADHRVVAALVEAAQNEKLGAPYHVGIGATTTCFNEGQARPDRRGRPPPQRLLDQHEELVQNGVLFYSMEEATLFVWCSTHGGYPAGAVDTVIAQRVTNEFRVEGEARAAHIACQALKALNI